MLSWFGMLSFQLNAETIVVLSSPKLLKNAKENPFTLAASFRR